MTATKAPDRRPARARSILAVLFMTALLVTSAHAGRGDKVGTASGSQLLIPVGARSIALGGSTLSSVSGIEAMFWNPAGLVRTDRSAEVLLSHMSYLGETGVEYFAGAKSLAGSAYLGLSVKALSLGDIPVTTEQFPDGTGEIVSPTFLVIGTTFSRWMSDQIAVGLSANILYERMAEVSATGIAFTGGIQYARLGGIDGLSVGVVIRNIGPKLTYDGDGLARTGIVIGADRSEARYKVEAASADLPSTIEVGLGYLYIVDEPLKIHFSSLFRNNNFADDEYKFGAEVDYRGMFYLRGGYTLSNEAEGNENIFGPAFGAGVITEAQNMRIIVDYAYRVTEYFSGNHVISLSIGF